MLRLTDGIFRACALEVARDFPEIAVEEQLVDSMAYRMVREPARWDVVVSTNLFGDILSDLAAALVGGLGLAASANVGDRHLLVEPVHGSAPDLVGRGIANPIATLRSLALLLAHRGAIGGGRPARARDRRLPALRARARPTWAARRRPAEVIDAICAELRATAAATSGSSLRTEPHTI